MESLRSRRCLRGLCYFCKLIKIQKLSYFLHLIPSKLNSLCHPNIYSAMRCKNDYFKNSFIPYVLREWNILSTEIRHSTSCQEFRKSLSIYHPFDVKLLVRLRLGFSHLREHKISQNFHDTRNPLCSCSFEFETTSHYLFCGHNFCYACLVLKNDLNPTEPNISQLDETALANILL